LIIIYKTRPASHITHYVHVLDNWQSFIACLGNVGHATIKYTPHDTDHPITLSPHQYTIVPSKTPGTFTVKFSPLLEATSITVIVDSPASPKVDYNLHLFVTACFEHEGLIVQNIFFSIYTTAISVCLNV